MSQVPNAKHALGEVELGLHADNCLGQNKNNSVLQVNYMIPIVDSYVNAYIFSNIHTYKPGHVSFRLMPRTNTWDKHNACMQLNEMHR